MAIVRSIKVLKQVFFTSTDEVNYGSICFGIDEITDTFEDGTVKVYNRYLKQDSRRFTDHGRAYFSYDNEAKWKAAMKRVARIAEANDLSEAKEYNY